MLLKAFKYATKKMCRILLRMPVHFREFSNQNQILSAVEEINNEKW